MNKDRVVKTIVLKAPRERVWQALTNSSAFGVWFGAKIDGPFIAGKEVTGRIMPTQVDADVAKYQESISRCSVARQGRTHRTDEVVFILLASLRRRSGRRFFAGADDARHLRAAGRGGRDLAHNHGIRICTVACGTACSSVGVERYRLETPDQTYREVSRPRSAGLNRHAAAQRFGNRYVQDSAALCSPRRPRPPGDDRAPFRRRPARHCRTQTGHRRLPSSGHQASLRARKRWPCKQRPSGT